MKLGCEKRVPRKDLEHHEEDSQQHLQLAIDAVDKQESKIDQLVLLQSKVASLQSSLLAKYYTPNSATPYKFKAEDFSELKDSSNEMFSPAFYTSPGGYKMCINVIPNGNGNGKGTHVSVFAYLMHGENDDHLPWPFTGTVTVELLNQLEDKNHHYEATTFIPDSRASQRVMDGERAPTGYGDQCYIPQSSLGYDEAKHCQYLKDDCLYFSVIVEAETTSKPWLVI